MTKILISVRNIAEAVLAAGDGAGSGADFIDLKEPRGGALGGLPVETLRAIVAALRERGSTLPVSATIGDLPRLSSSSPLSAVLAKVQAVADCGVDYVKVGIARDAGAAPLLRTLAACGAAVVPVFIADHGLDDDAVALACSLGFPGLMVDTADKRSGSLFDLMSMVELRRFLQAVRASGAMAGLAGALRLQHLPAVRELAPDFAGFRSALCAGDRGSALDARRLQALAAALREIAVES